MSLRLRDLKAGDAVIDGGHAYEAQLDAFRVTKPDDHKDGHECQMLGLTGPLEGKTVTFFEDLNAGCYSLKLERLHRQSICT